MSSAWLDAAHRRLWRLAESTHSCAVQDNARGLVRTVEEELKSIRDRNDCGWTSEKAKLLAALDIAHLSSITCSAQRPTTVPLGLVLLELASLDGGLATLHLSRCLAQMPIADFGTTEQKARYLSGRDFLHGALCLTEPIPGAGTEALLLMGSYRPVADLKDGPLWIEVDKRGRFTSHMEFADFVVAAVKGTGGARGSALVVLEPHDTGEFGRGMPVRKIGHRIASTTNPFFRLRVPAARIVGGCEMEDGILRPRFDHRQLLEPALRRMRALLGLMTAAKALASVCDFVPDCGSVGPEFWLLMADLWATGEAAASFGFLAARLSDELDSGGATCANLFAPAAKLFATTHTIPALSRVAAFAGPGVDDLHRRIADAQVEAMYMGPEASQRRMVSTFMTEETFPARLAEWINELDRLPTAQCLAAGFKLWSLTFAVLRECLSATRQSAAFALADSLCTLLAVRSLLLDVMEIKSDIFRDLVWLASVRAASQAMQTSANLVCGDSQRVALSTAMQKEMAERRADIYAGMTGFQYARERIALLLSDRYREQI